MKKSIKATVLKAFAKAAHGIRSSLIYNPHHTLYLSY